MTGQPTPDQTQKPAIDLRLGCLGSVFWVCVTVLILAFAGEPDIIDALIERIGR